MASPIYEPNLEIGEIKIPVRKVVHFDYQHVWDRGPRLHLIIEDDNMDLHRDLKDISGNPTPEVKFKLEYKSSEGRSYENEGATHVLHIANIFMITTKDGPAIRIIAVSKFALIACTTTTSFYEKSARANEYIQNLCQHHDIKAEIPETGDRAAVHRSRQIKIINAIRYELDRVLSTGGKPITLQYDDRADESKLLGFGEFYEDATQELDTFSGSRYTYGNAMDTESPGAGYGTAAYGFSIGQDFTKVQWGHNVSGRQLTTTNELIEGDVEARLANRLGIDGEILRSATQRLQIAGNTSDDANTDEYYHRSTLVNRVFQTEMSMTSGYVIIDADFKAFDDPSILNRSHIYVSVSSGQSVNSGHALIPNECVVMGYQHILNIKGGWTKVLIRRGK